MDGVRPVADMIERVNAISAELGDPKDDTDSDALLAEMGELQEKIDAAEGCSLDSQLEQAVDALLFPLAEWSVAILSSCDQRRIALCRLLPVNTDDRLLAGPTKHH